MQGFFDWFRVFRRVDPPPRVTPCVTDAVAYHARRFAQERESARQARSAAARDAHRRLAAAHRVAMEATAQDKGGTPDRRQAGEPHHRTGEGR